MEKLHIYGVILICLTIGINNIKSHIGIINDYDDDVIKCEKSDKCKPSNNLDATIYVTDEISCFCDSCDIFNDCCDDIIVSFKNKDLDKHRCNINLGFETYAYSIVKCRNNWKSEDIREKCEIINNSSFNLSNSLMTQIPVYSLHRNVTYQNIYCAICNFETLNKLKFYELKLNHPLDVELDEYKLINQTIDSCFKFNKEQNNCRIEFEKPIDVVIKRKCIPGIATCLLNETQELTELCNNHTAYRYDIYTRRVYKNKYYALCNGIPLNSLHCNLPLTVERFDLTTYSIRILFDISQFDGNLRINFKADANGHIIYDNCNNNNYSNHTKTRLSALICKETLAISENRNLSGILKNYQTENEYIQKYITIIGQSISIISLLIFLIIYGSFKSLRNQGGKILICLSISLLLAQINFILPIFTPKHILYANQFGFLNMCYVYGTLTHYSYLCFFAWSNIIAYDLFKTLTIFTSRNNNLKLKSYKFTKYSLYACGMPLCLVSLLTLSQFIHRHVAYGSDKSCFISNKTDLIVFFIVPVAFLLLSNIFFFIQSVISIRRVDKTSKIYLKQVSTDASSSTFLKSRYKPIMPHKDTSKSKKSVSSVYKNDVVSRLFLFFKLFSLMGISWITGVLSLLTNIHNFFSFIWYIYIVTNSLQGLVILLSFLFNRKTMKEIKQSCVCCR